MLLIAELARAAGCHAYMAHCAQRLRYTMPVPREPRDEMASLQREFVAAVAAQQRLVAQMQQIADMAAPAGLKAVA